MRCAAEGCKAKADEWGDTCEARERYYYCDKCKAVTEHAATMCGYDTCDMERCTVCADEKHMYGLRRTT